MAAAFTLTIQTDSITPQLAALAGKLPAAQSRALQRAAQLLRDTIVDKYVGAGHPAGPNVVTGRLKASIRYTPTNPTDVVYVGTDADYAPYVEFGHSQTPGRFVPALGKRLVASEVKPYPFMRPAILEVFDGGQAKRVVMETLREELGL
jgi:hypothetical protein